MPALGWVIGAVTFSDLALTLGMNAATNEPVLLKYGVFLQAIFDFLIIAFAIFMAVKGINRLKKPPAPAPAPAPVPPPPRQEVLLEEIRDLLKKG